MEIYQIRAFVTVARAGNLTRAAEALSLTQPAVTAQIKALEQSLGVTLFERSVGKITLARAGQSLLPVAETLLANANQLKAEAAQLKGELHGIIDLGVPSERMEFLRLDELAGRITTNLPMIELQTHVLPTVQLVDHVAVGKLSAALTIAVTPPRGLQWFPLRSVTYRLVVPKNLAAANRRSGWRELADLPWIDGPHGSHTHLLLRDLFERHGLTPRTVMHSDDQANIDSLVRAGAGCALLREEIALAGVRRQDFMIWGHAKIDATLGFASSNERAAEPALIALISMLKEIWQIDAMAENN